jgi:hypothetical protein
MAQAEARKDVTPADFDEAWYLKKYPDVAEGR